MKIMLWLIITLVFWAGCQSAPQQDISALGAVTEGLTGQSISEKDLKHLAAEAQKDAPTQSALKSISQALSAQHNGVKYCPVDGARFSAVLDECPAHHVRLRNLE